MFPSSPIPVKNTIQLWVKIIPTLLRLRHLTAPWIYTETKCLFCMCLLFSEISPHQHGVFLWQWQMCSSAVCPLTSLKSVLTSAHTCQNTGWRAASSLLCPSPGKHHITPPPLSPPHTHTAPVDFNIHCCQILLRKMQLTSASWTWLHC